MINFHYVQFVRQADDEEAQNVAEKVIDAIKVTHADGDGDGDADDKKKVEFGVDEKGDTPKIDAAALTTFMKNKYQLVSKLRSHTYRHSFY